MARSYCNLLYHIVFSTKDRDPWLEADLRTRCSAYLGGAIRDEGGIALIVNGTYDHVHILAKLRQDKAVSDVVRDVKSNSSGGWFRRPRSGAGPFLRGDPTAPPTSAGALAGIAVGFTPSPPFGG